MALTIDFSRQSVNQLKKNINGFKKPSAERESEILAHIHKLGKEMIAACF